MREFLQTILEYRNSLSPYGTPCHLFSQDGKYLVYSKDDVDHKPCHIVSVQISQGTWYFPILDKLEERYGKFDLTFDRNGLTYYIWRIK